MKNIFLLLMTLVAQSALAQIKFEQAVTVNPLVVEVVYAYCGYSSCVYSDAAGIQRLNISLTGGYILKNSVGEVISTVETSAELAKQTARALSGSSKVCPGKVSIDRSTVKIFDAQTACGAAGVATMQLTSKYAGYSSTNLYDSTNNTRLIYYPSLKTYVVNFGTGINVDKKLADADISKFEYYIKNVRSACPLTVDYNPLTGDIIKLKIGCDPLASIDSTEERG
jgi:hypothetical protein